MGLFSRLLSFGDETAKTADEGGKFADNTADEFVSNDETTKAFWDESPTGTNPDFATDSYPKRVFADFTGRVGDGSSPAAVVDAGTSNLVTAGKFVGGGTVAGVGLWAGSEMYDDYTALKTAESKEAAYEEYQDALEKIRNNPNLSPDQKEEAIARLREAYQLAIKNDENGGSKGALTDVMGDLFGGMGMMDKLLIGIAFVVLVKAVISRGGR